MLFDPERQIKETKQERTRISMSTTSICYAGHLTATH